MKKEIIAGSAIAALVGGAAVMINQPKDVEFFCCETNIGCKVDISVEECSANVGWAPYEGAECNENTGFCVDINDGTQLRVQ